MRAFLATDRYDALETNEYRETVRRELGKTYKRSGNVIVPYGFALGFTGPDGSEWRFSTDEDGALTFGKQAEAPISLASVAYVTEVANDLNGSIATTTAEVVAARSGEVSLLARVTTVNLAATNAAGAAAAAQSEITAARQGEASLTAKVTQLALATSTLDGRVSAYYGVKVSAGTNVASLELLATGGGAPLSQAILTATNFIINGNTLINGTVTALALNVATLSAITADLGTVVAGILRNSGSTWAANATLGVIVSFVSGYMKVVGASFGASSDLQEWWGPTPSGASVTDPKLSTLTKTNGVWAQANDGKVYYDGSELAPATAFSAYVDELNPTGPIPATSPDTTQTVTMTITGGVGPYDVTWDGGVDLVGADTWTLNTVGTLQYRWAAATPPPGTSFLYEKMYTATVRDSEGRTVLVTVYPSLFR